MTPVLRDILRNQFKMSQIFIIYINQAFFLKEYMP